MDITSEVIDEAARLGGVLLRNYQGKINRAYLEVDDDLSVAIKFNLSPAGDGVMIKADLNFVAERVKDHATKLVQSGRQGVLPFESRRAARPRVTCGLSEGARRRMRWYGRR